MSGKDIGSELIESDAFDSIDDLKELRRVIDMRLDYLAKRMTRSLRPGDKIRVHDDVSPHYIRNLEGMVLGHRGDKLRVKFDPVPLWYPHAGRINAAAWKLQPHHVDPILSDADLSDLRAE